MKCPIDQTQLAMTDRQGIEIDYCPECRGVWLDRGELDKIIERSSTSPTDNNRATNPEQPHYQDSQPHHQEQHNYDDRQYGKKHKKEGFLGELFDF